MQNLQDTLKEALKFKTATSPTYHNMGEEEDHEKGENVRVVYTKRSNFWPYACITLLALGWASTIFYNHANRTQYGALWHLDAATPIPREVFKPVKKVFGPDQRYMGWSDEVNKNWDKLVAGHDTVYIEDPDKWELPLGELVPFDHPNMPSPKPQNFYVISTLHSLHCLNMVRFQYFKIKNGLGYDNPNYPKLFWDVHVEHCFEYMRQAISCGGDLVLEGDSAIRINGGQVTSVTGWGGEHDCIDFDRLLSFVNEQEIKYNQTWQSV